MPTWHAFAFKTVTKIAWLIQRSKKNVYSASAGSFYRGHHTERRNESLTDVKQTCSFSAWGTREDRRRNEYPPKQPVSGVKGHAASAVHENELREHTGRSRKIVPFCFPLWTVLRPKGYDYYTFGLQRVRFIFRDKTTGRPTTKGFDLYSVATSQKFNVFAYWTRLIR